MTESRTFRMHDKLLLDVIKKQAGSIQKAVLEGVMNSIEAGASKVDVSVEPTQIRVIDDGRGFQSREKIELFFETFGQPHTESENKRWAQFRMGRGQLFAFGKNEWRTGPYMMRVDINQRLGYELQANPQPVKGCIITINLYEPLNDREIYSVVKEVGAFVKFVSIPVLVNGRQVNTPPEQRSWGPETNDDAYISLTDGNDLLVYNLGVLVCRLPKYRFGVAGTIVTKKRIEVNFARNEVIKSCPVWKRIQTAIDQSDPVTRIRRKRVLTDDERVSVIERICSGEIRPYDARTLPLFVDVSGHGWSPSSITRAKFATWSYASVGDLRGDKLIQSGTCLVLDENVLRNFDVHPLWSIFEHRWADGYSLLWSPLRFVPFGIAVQKLRDIHLILPKDKLRPSERAWQRVIDFMSGQIGHLSDRVSPGHRELIRALGNRREIYIGVSDTAEAWTDGQSLVVFNRQFLADQPLQKFQRPMIGSLIAVGQTLIHELCHDGDSTTQVHSPEFYKNFHALSDALPWAVERTCQWLTPKKLARLAKSRQGDDEGETEPQPEPQIEVESVEAKVA